MSEASMRTSSQCAVSTISWSGTRYPVSIVCRAVAVLAEGRLRPSPPPLLLLVLLLLLLLLLILILILLVLLLLLLLLLPLLLLLLLPLLLPPWLSAQGKQRPKFCERVQSRR